MDMTQEGIKPIKTINYKFGTYVGETMTNEDNLSIPHGAGKFIFDVKGMYNVHIQDVFEGDFVNGEIRENDEIRILVASNLIFTVALTGLGQLDENGKVQGMWRSTLVREEDVDGTDVVDYQITYNKYTNGKPHGDALRMRGGLSEGYYWYEGEYDYTNTNNPSQEHGKGKSRLANKDGSHEDIYEGDWVKGKKHGKGKHTMLSDGEWNQYEGAFKNNKCHGKGIIIYRDGMIYEGKFKKGERHGKGILTLQDGTSHLAKLKNGELVKMIKPVVHPSHTTLQAETASARAVTVTSIIESDIATSHVERGHTTPPQVHWHKDYKNT